MSLSDRAGTTGGRRSTLIFCSASSFSSSCCARREGRGDLATVQRGLAAAATEGAPMSRLMLMRWRMKNGVKKAMTRMAQPV